MEEPPFQTRCCVKYIISEAPVQPELYELYAEDKEHKTEAYLNPYALPIAYGVSSGIKDVRFDSFETPFTRLNTVLAAMLGRGEAVEVFKELPIEETTTHNLTSAFTSNHIKYTVESEGNGTARITYKITCTNDRNVYMYIPTEYQREVSLSVNSYSKGSYFANETMRIVDLGSYDVGTILYINLTLKEDEVYIRNNADNFFYYMDDELFKTTMTELNDSPLTVTDYSDTHISGNITVNEGDDLLFTTIPYDKGWSVKIDGESAELLKTADSLLAVKISGGEHTVEFKYLPNEFVMGISISIFGVIAFAAVCLISVKQQKKRKQIWLNSVDMQG